MVFPSQVDNKGFVQNVILQDAFTVKTKDFKGEKYIH